MYSIRTEVNALSKKNSAVITLAIGLGSRFVVNPLLKKLRLHTEVSSSCDKNFEVTKQSSEKCTIYVGSFLRQRMQKIEVFLK
jgi:hypothetical protein